MGAMTFHEAIDQLAKALTDIKSRCFGEEPCDILHDLEIVARYLEKLVTDIERECRDSDGEEPHELGLLPCPFCGAQPMLKESKHAFGVFIIFCPKCGARMGDDSYEYGTTKEQVVEMWNKRRNSNGGILQLVKAIHDACLMLSNLENASYTELRPCIEEYKLDPKHRVFRLFATEEEWEGARKAARFFQSRIAEIMDLLENALRKFLGLDEDDDVIYETESFLIKSGAIKEV